MIDLHAHILPGIDDGAENIEESIKMCRLSWESGIRGIAATSHGNSRKGCSLEEYKIAYHRLLQELKKEEIPLMVYPGMEVFMNHEACDRLDSGELLTLNHTRYVLVEFAFEEELWMVNDYLQMLDEAGYCPVIAHAERYTFIQKHPEEACRWANMGYVIQVNKGSLLGSFGKREWETAISLLEHNLIHVVSSDTHGSNKRTPNMNNIVRFFNETVGTKVRNLVLSENPGRILRGDEILAFPPKPYRRNLFW